MSTFTLRSTTPRALLCFLFALCSAFGCAVTPRTSSAPAAAAVPPLATQALASVETKLGRLDAIASPNGRSIKLGSLVMRRTERDPVIDLLFRLTHEPKRVLLLGVGTGQLSVDLVKRGVHVDILESDAAIARTVCVSDGCGGSVVVDNEPWYVIDGHTANAALTHLGPSAAASSLAYDAVVFDDEVSAFPTTFLRRDLKGVPLTPSAVVLRRARWSKPLPASEADTEPPLILIGEREDGTFDTIRIISGPDAELDGAGLRVWPAQQMIDVLPDQRGEEKTIRVFGYLVKTPAGQTSVELPHDREGAVVVLLTGEKTTRELAPRATSGVHFHNARADKGKTDNLMIPLLGPGHRLREGRSLVASDIVVALRGKARFLHHGHIPNDAYRSGASYTLEVETIERVLDRAAWAPIEARHLARLEAARVKVIGGDLGGAASELEASVAYLRAALGLDADHCQWIHATENLAQALREVEKKGLVESCSWLTQFSPTHPTTMRPVAHSADVALYRALKTSSDGTLLRLAKKPGKSLETEQAAGCWWRSTFHDPGFPNATHLEISQRFPGIAQPVRD